MGIHKHHSHRHTSSSTKHSRHHRHGESKSKHKHHTKKKHHHHHRHKHKKKSHHKKHRSTEPEVELENKILQDALDCLEASALTAIQSGNHLTPQALDAIVSSTLSKARRNGEEGEGGEGSEDSNTDTTLSSSEDEIGGSGGAEKEFKVEVKNVPETKLERKGDQSSRQSAKTNVESSSSKISEYIGIEDQKRSESQSSSKNQLLDSHSSSKDDVDSRSSLKSHSSDSQSSSKDRTVSQSSSNSKNEMEFHSKNKILSQSNSESSKIESQSTSGSKDFFSSSNRETQSSFGSKDTTGSGSKEKAESQSIKDKMESDSKGKALSQSSSNLKDKEFSQSSLKDKAESDSESSSDDDSPISTKSIPSLANRASKIKIKIGKDLGDAKVERDENSSACCEQNMKQSVVSGNSKVTYVNLKAVSSDIQAKSRAGGTDSDAGGSGVIKRVHNESEGSAPGPKLKSKSPGSKLKSKSPDSNPDSNKEKASKKKRKRLQSRSRSRSRGRSRYCSRSRERSGRISRSKSRDSYNRSKKERSRSRSPYRHYSKSGCSRSHSRSKHRSRSRKRNHRSHSRSRKRRSHRSRSSSSSSGSRSPARGKKLLKESAKPSEVVQSISAIAKGFSEVVKNKEKQNNISVLTNFCKSLQKKQKLEDELGPEVAAAAESASEETDYRVPFMVGPVPMYQTGYVYHNNTWKSANQIIAETNAANAALVAPRPLTDVFPVSTGIQHKKSSDLDEELSIAAAQKSSAVDISSLAIQRLQASERLKHNPTDFEALSTLATIENQTRQWAASKMIPGQYTGEQTLSPLTREDHKAGIQAWAKKKMFHDLAPVMSGFGMKMLKKMGWNEGRSLGKEGKGCLEPLAMDVKMDRTGLCTEMDKRPPVLQPSPALPTMMIAPTLVATDTKSAHLVQGKHPVSALQEICSKKRWDNPVYELVQAAGPAHNKTFHYQVTIPLGTFKSANASKNKKQAKMEAAAAALQGLGLVDRKQ